MPPSSARRRPSALLTPALALAAALAATACGPSNEYEPPPPAAVTVARPEVRDVTRYADYTGRTEAIEKVEVRARVDGYLREMRFEPGDVVEKDSVLFVIDPRPFEIELASAQASLASAKAELLRAQAQLDRQEQALRTKAVSEIEVIQSRAERDKAAAAVRTAESQVRDAELNLDYAYVKAPISGRVGRNLVDVGNLVNAESTLAEMVRYDPIYVYFNLSERDILTFQRTAGEERERTGTRVRGRLPFSFGLADEEGFPHEGVIDYSALEVNPQTGTFEVRGVLDNAGPRELAILPGLFVRVRLPIGEIDDALLVNERAVAADQTGPYVLVVNQENVVEQRSIEIGGAIDGKVIVESGLRPEDRVIVSGAQRARPGSEVAPKTAGAPSDTPQPASGDTPSAPTG